MRIWEEKYTAEGTLLRSVVDGLHAYDTVTPRVPEGAASPDVECAGETLLAESKGTLVS